MMKKPSQPGRSLETEVPSAKLSRASRKRETPAAGGTAVDRRTMLLQIAARRFAEFGYEATTVRQISDEARILSGSLYHHFLTKDEMLHDLVGEISIHTVESDRRISELPMDAEQRLCALVRHTIDDLTGPRRHQHTVLFAERKFFRNNPDFAYIAERRALIYRYWNRIVVEGVEAGLFRKNLDPFLTVAFIMRMVNATGEWRSPAGDWAPPLGDYSLEEVIDSQLEFILHAVRTADRLSAPVPERIALDLDAPG